MSHTFTKLLTHIIFSTKERRSLMDDELQRCLFPYLSGIIREMGGTPLTINGPSDHVHLLAQTKASVSTAKVKEHHRKISFQEEFISFLQKYGIEYDERYIWK